MGLERIQDRLAYGRCQFCSIPWQQPVLCSQLPVKETGRKHSPVVAVAWKKADLLGQCSRLLSHLTSYRGIHADGVEWSFLFSETLLCRPLKNYRLSLIVPWALCMPIIFASKWPKGYCHPLNGKCWGVPDLHGLPVDFSLLPPFGLMV